VGVWLNWTNLKRVVGRIVKVVVILMAIAFVLGVIL
jgi:hypothetical protein